MRKIVFSFSVLLSLTTIAFAQIDTLKYRISLTDKLNSEYCIDKPEEFLSVKAIERRKKQGLPIDETDLPVNKTYINQIKESDLNVVAVGKWDNFVTVSCNDPRKIDSVRKFPFIKDIELVWEASEADKKNRISQRDTISNDMKWLDTYYGVGIEQIQISGVDKLHAEGFKGEGITIAVIDAGFHNVDSIKGMDNIEILGTKDFVNPTSDIFAENSHGMAVLSCMAMNKPHYMVGTAPKASYWLLRSEDDRSEHLVEQDYWAAAIEFADSVGVDVVNTSLGYNEFDDKSKNYRYRDLDGSHALMSRQASKVADKGMILVCSAGNSGMGSWKKTTTPGDAFNVITVGAVDKEGVLAPFSSIGNTADGRIKPDVVAVGLFADVMGTDGILTTANGTSFASPIMCGMVACLWESLPHLTAYEIIKLVQSVGDRVDFPNNIYGYGIPNLWQAYLKEKK
ncbi:S8 family peptidase [Bacteroides coprosuis]|uniref:S8 family peptidase n=1 Tax=Bacteroides coprosuis TaxID=151276 RepID=UPI001D979823|nr:S8 family serine peptidase [Bacteroides coprosuis]HJD91242.1 S8 family serine peptidase [Bacteroides coprosuis]